MEKSRNITIVHLAFELLPFVNFTLNFFPGHNVQTIKAVNLNLQTRIAQIVERCRAHFSKMYAINVCITLKLLFPYLLLLFCK